MATTNTRLNRRNPARETSDGNVRVLETPLTSPNAEAGDESEASSESAPTSNEDAATSSAEDSSPAAAPARRGRKARDPHAAAAADMFAPSAPSSGITKRMDLAMLSDGVMEFSARHNMAPVDVLLGVQTLLEATGDIEKVG